MPVKKVTSNKKPATSMTVPVYSLAGVASGNLSLPKELFGANINNTLLAQAMRVYLNNQKGHFSNTKTRGEVEGSTRKIWRQKGTGRARHGGIRAPIFIGGGIALGPKYRKVILDLPKKIKKASLISALSLKKKENEIFGISNLDKASGKTSQMAKFLKKLGKTSVLIVADKKEDKAFLSVRNLKKLNILEVNMINTFDVIKHQSLLLTKEAVEKLEERLLKEKK